MQELEEAVKARFICLRARIGAHEYVAMLHGLFKLLAKPLVVSPVARPLRFIADNQNLSTKSSSFWIHAEMSIAFLGSILWLCAASLRMV